MAHWRAVYAQGGGHALAASLREETSGRVRAEEGEPLSDADVRALLHGATAVKTYPDLRAARSMDDVLHDGRCALLYLTTSDTEGHWTGILRTPRGIEYFDSYGHAPDEPLTWLSPQKAMALHEGQRDLTRLLHDASARGEPVSYNKHAFQALRNRNMATCGRHVACRLMCNDMTLPEYADMLASTGMNADEFVTRVTDAELARMKRKA